jgi:hypothetical protein
MPFGMSQSQGLVQYGSKLNKLLERTMKSGFWLSQGLSHFVTLSPAL